MIGIMFLLSRGFDRMQLRTEFDKHQVSYPVCYHLLQDFHGLPSRIEHFFREPFETFPEVDILEVVSVTDICADRVFYQKLYQFNSITVLYYCIYRTLFSSHFQFAHLEVWEFLSCINYLILSVNNNKTDQFDLDRCWHILVDYVVCMIFLSVLRRLFVHTCLCTMRGESIKVRMVQPSSHSHCLGQASLLCKVWLQTDSEVAMWFCSLHCQRNFVSIFQ